MPDQSGQIAEFVSQMERVGQLFQQLFGSTQTVIRAMDTLYDVMTNTGQSGWCHHTDTRNPGEQNKLGQLEGSALIHLECFVFLRHVPSVC